jgi:pyrimidine-nucleoside phosphorylase
MLVAAGQAKDVESGARSCEKAIESGRALELFMANIGRQGGDRERMLGLRGSWRSRHSFELRAPEPGFVAGIDAYQIGLAGVNLGVGRDKTTDPVYPDVGVIFEKKVGDRVAAGDRVCSVFGKDAASLAAARKLVEPAVSYSRERPPARPLVIEEISAL